jgi:hypothetical protein
MVDYVRLAATASRLIQQNGAPVTLTKPVSDLYDPVTGSADARSPLTFDGFAINDPEGDYQQAFDDSGRKRQDFAQLWVSMPDAAPEPGDAIEWKGQLMSVQAVTPLAPGPLTLLYKVRATTP